MVRKALGKGLDALIPTDDTAGSQKRIVNLDITKIKRNRYQPRSSFNKTGIKELAQSIKENGVIQPIIVRKAEDGYELIAGERRLRAIGVLGMSAAPAIIVEADDGEMLEMALVENIQRDDLNPMDCAAGFKQLAESFNLTQEQIAQKVGKERASVANYLRLLSLSPKVQQLIRDEKLSFGHARALLGVENPKAQEILAALVASEGLSVRECEQLVRGKKIRKKEKPETAAVPKDYQFEMIQDRFQQVLGTKVKISPKKNGGIIEIQYYSSDDLQRILNYFDFEEDDLE